MVCYMGKPGFMFGLEAWYQSYVYVFHGTTDRLPLSFFLFSGYWI